MQIYPFNIVYIFLMLLGAATLMLIWHALRDKPETTRKRVLVIICALNIVFYFVYKGFLSVDAEFLEISGLESFNWFNELPLQLCNINLFLIPLGVMTKKRGVLGFSFFIAPLAAMLALLFPEIAFTGYSLSQPRILGYYVTHLLIVICGLSLFTLGFYRPDFKDFPGIVAAFIVLSLGAHLVNIVLRHSVCPQANYFFTFGADISILNLLWSFIPKAYVYLLPGLLILLAYMTAITVLIRLVSDSSARRAAESKV